MDDKMLRQRFMQETITELYQAQVEKLIQDNAKLKVQLDEVHSSLPAVCDKNSSKRSMEDSMECSRQNSTKRMRDTHERDGQSSKLVEVNTRWNKCTPRDHKEYAEYIAKNKLCVYDLTSHYRIESLSKKTGYPFVLRCNVNHENPNVLHVKDLKRLGVKYSQHAALCLVNDQFGYSERDYYLGRRLCECILEDKDGFFSPDVAPLA